MVLDPRAAGRKKRPSSITAGGTGGRVVWSEVAGGSNQGTSFPLADDAMKCPKCSGVSLRRSRSRPGRDRLYRVLLPIYYFRCTECHARMARVTPRAVLAFAGRVALVAIPFVAFFLLIMSFIAEAP